MCRHYTAVVCMLEYAYFRACRKDHAMHAGDFIAGKYGSYFYTLFYYTTFLIILPLLYYSFITLLFYYVTLYICPSSNKASIYIVFLQMAYAADATGAHLQHRQANTAVQRNCSDSHADIYSRHDSQAVA